MVRFSSVIFLARGAEGRSMADAMHAFSQLYVSAARGASNVRPFVIKMLDTMIP